MSLDQSIIIAIHEWHSPWLDGLMWWVSQRDSSIVLYLMMLFLLMRKFQLSMWKVIVMIGLLVTFNDQLASSVFKPLICRLRPSHDPLVSSFLHLLKDEKGQLYAGGRYGFYSSHAANTMAAAIFFILVMRPLNVIWTMTLTIWVVLVGFSRIYLGVHYPSDILMGWVIGSLSAWGFWRLLRLPKLMRWHKLVLH